MNTVNISRMSSNKSSTISFRDKKSESYSTAKKYQTQTQETLSLGDTSMQKGKWSRAKTKFSVNSTKSKYRSTTPLKNNHSFFLS